METEHMSKIIESIENDVYTHSCRCPNCGNKMYRGSEEATKFCEKCGQQLHLRAFTKEEIDDAIFQHRQDEYED